MKIPVYKGLSRFSQRLATSKRVRLKTASIPTNELERGTAYVTKLAPQLRELVLRGLNNSEIAKELEKRGVGTPSGEAWSPDRVSNILAATKSRKRLRRGKKPKLV